MSSLFSSHQLLPSLSSSSSSSTRIPDYVNPPSFALSIPFCSNPFLSIKTVEAKDGRRQLKFDFRSRNKSRTQDEYQLDLPKLKWLETVENDLHEEADHKLGESFETNEIKKYVEAIKSMLESVGDGGVKESAYDTAWVALVEDVNGSDSPQFPSCLEWIANNQNPDGSWGDRQVFLSYDRILNTLACVIALTRWNVHPDKCEKGMAFFNQNISKLKTENPENMLAGFEISFPALLEKARSLNIEIQDQHSSVLDDIFAQRDIKLKRIPMELLHQVPTTLLLSLEGIPDLDWEKLLKLQSFDGSFFFALASSAFAFIQTKDEKVLSYLNGVVQKYKGGVPFVYPLDTFEHLWVVDRLERLGISRYFQHEIKERLNYCYRYWTDKGIGSTRDSDIPDLDDTAMAFRLLRLHGYDVSTSAIQHFEKDGEFFCYPGQSSEGVTVMLNTYRASQVIYHGEKILEKAKQFTGNYLRTQRAANRLLDKWVMTKDLPGEVCYALDIPWYGSLPRIEARFYIEQYGGADVVWIAKTLYRMPYINDDLYLELAKLDYNNCQAIHRKEWDNIQRWYQELKLAEFGLSRENLLLEYFLAAASIFESNRSTERLAWTKTAILIKAIRSNLDNEESRRAFAQEFNNSISAPSIANLLERSLNTSDKEQRLSAALVKTILNLSLDIRVAHGHEVKHNLYQAWRRWLSRRQREGNRYEGEADLLVQTINLSAGNLLTDESNEEYQRLVELTDRVCSQLRYYKNDKKSDSNGSSNTTPEIESDMQELLQLVLQSSSDGIHKSNVKNTFLVVAKTFYYAAYCLPETINFHIGKVLFESVV
ncbi:Copalyl diphosphate synthase [Quillaja saponaria]|uniref:Copalyl diphosphate synthase n=1 Tax=Quillaja saponaria TaxID=32244 RepID=A0AAD7L3G0_QUISA|nr:Copalyl diphosphate synthase [Quillaja saponaria]